MLPLDLDIVSVCGSMGEYFNGSCWTVDDVKYLSMVVLLQVLRNGKLQSRSDRRIETESSDTSGGRCNRQLQERKPHDVRVGDSG